ncbi:SMP-30/gluconolactonase/LRE family protein [Nocardia sp. NBC_00565]|uniref:SMP-30/gluconolactonase/LRE family protein n=1 Tax=Nocardia sp. NBC_00565 TaxID=2975993 RepID=UPI002E7FD627|nr:SMP-30/gluconolactonase/LRE family protein [Nocardia sp. NBC_00565]WUC06213.1 SMP-30/gluconolactonase/LRE family protein [Nocardia sp. NBC_00565]
MQPQRWTPPAAPPRAHETHSAPRLPPVTRLELPGKGPEDIVLTEDGRVVVGVDDGSIYSIDPADGAVRRLANTGGRPLGLHADAYGSILICDFAHGLLRLDSAGTIDVLVDEVDGEPLPFASNVVRADDGTIYFSASSRRYPLDQYMGDLMEHSGTGRLFRLDPSGKLETLIDGLQFANGVVLSPDGSCVLVAETGGYRVTRYWLTGPKAGTHDRLIENLPGFPDNMALGSDGLVWITLPAPRNPLLDRLLPLPGILRRIVWALPEWVQPKPPRTVWVLAVDFDGKIVHDLQTEGTDFSMVTGVVERNGTLYLGSLTESAVAVSHIPS